jgi:LPS sulfotransferase NodH
VNGLLCIVASQRAGTTSLEQALGSTGRFMVFGEVFHSDTSLWPGAFFDFTRTRRIGPEGMATGEQAEQVASDYLDHLTELAGDRRPLLDVKFNSWHALRSAWGYPHQKPLFMESIQKRRGLFLFIRRRDVTQQVVSELIARAADKWHGLTDADIPEQIRLEPQAVVRHARLILRAENFFIEHLDAKCQYLGIDYEDLYPGGEINPRLLRELERRMRIDLPATLAPLTPRNVPDKRLVTSNYDEVAQAVEAAACELKRLEPAARII